MSSVAVGPFATDPVELPVRDGQRYWNGRDLNLVGSVALNRPPNVTVVVGFQLNVENATTFTLHERIGHVGPIFPGVDYRPFVRGFDMDEGTIMADCFLIGAPFPVWQTSVAPGVWRVIEWGYDFSSQVRADRVPLLRTAAIGFTFQPSLLHSAVTLDARLACRFGGRVFFQDL